MEQITVSSKGQIAIPKSIREALNLQEGTKLNLELKGHTILLSKEPVWKNLHGAGSADSNELMSAFALYKKQERDRENSGS